jgi:dephospho-CoA kinase
VTPPRKFLLVGLTGGIATGKSTVAETLRRLGAEVIDADQLARDVVAPGEPALAEIVREFGDVLQPEGTLDRKKLGAIVFADTMRRKRLESITHPAIRARFAARVQELEDRGFEGLVFFDAPVMIESGNYRNMDRLVVVFTDEPTQRGRLMTRDAMTESEARKRVAMQMPVADKAALAHYVIDNTGDRAATEARTREVYAALMADLRARDRR